MKRGDSKAEKAGLSARVLAWGMCLTVFAGILLTFALMYLNGAGVASSGLPFLPFASAVVGFMVATRQPRNAVGWVFLASALFAVIRAVSGEYAIYGILTAPGSVPFAELCAWFSVLFRIPGPMLSFVVLPLLFPNGRVPSPGWRILLWIIILSTIPIMILDSFAPGVAVYDTSIQNPFGVESLSIYSRYFYDGGPLIYWFIALIFASAASLVFRYRAAGLVEQQQIKWLTLAAGFIPIWFSVNAPVGRAFPLFFAVCDSLVIAAPPVAAGIAILRYRLYEIDRIINRALVYAALTALLALVYFALIAVFQWGMGEFVSEESRLVVVVSTLAIAALFSPLRRGLQSFIDRRFYRRRYDARATLDEFSMRLRDEVELENLTRDLAGVVRKTFRPEHISISLIPSASERVRHGEHPATPKNFSKISKTSKNHETFSP